MSLFHQKLKDIVKAIDNRRLEQAHQILSDHFNSEYATEGDLAGLAGALQSYKSYLQTAKDKLARLKGGGLKTTSDSVKDTIANAEIELGRIIALISKLRSDAKIKLS